MLRGGIRAFQRVLSQAPPASLRRALAAPRVPLLPRFPAALVGARAFGSEFLTGANNAYLEEMYDAWKQDPASVHKSWDVYFRTGQSAHVPNSNSGVVTHVDVVGVGGVAAASTSVEPADFRVLSLIRAYRSRGHEVAKLNPILPVPADKADLLNIENFGFTEAERSMPIENWQNLGVVEEAKLLQRADGSADGNGTTTLGELVDFLKATYCGEAAYEFSHINDPVVSAWLKDRVERVPEPLSKDYQKKMLGHLALGDRFERFLAKRFNTAKRFGVEGLETLIPGLNAVVDEAAVLGVQNLILGMAHRGRLNVLTNVMGKPFELVFKEFQGILESPADWSGTGDVKYHLGTSSRITHAESGKVVNVVLLPNPSHLEAVNTVVLGKARAKMDGRGDTTGETVLPVLLHGDAAFAGQGIAYETMQLAKLRNYHTGGALHIITNNQVGFTTNPEDSRSTLHPSDLAKAFKAPVFHVNADNLFEVCRVFKIAAQCRQRFRTDVVINLLGYRRCVRASCGVARGRAACCVLRAACCVLRAACCVLRAAAAGVFCARARSSPQAAA
jgi:2-oxoglutarate dehydrogenase E1 component